MNDLAAKWMPVLARRKWWILLALTVGALVVVGVHFGEHAMFGWLRAALGALREAVDDAPFEVVLVYFLIYVATSAVSLPFGGILTLTAGALFGFWWGMLLACVSASVGGLAGFLVARYLLHSAVERRFGAQLAPIHNGLREEGAFYLFALRMVPVFPYWLVNLLMSLTSMPAFTFWWVSALGMLPLEAAYVFAGTQVATVTESHGSVLSIDLLAALLGLALLPLLLRRVVRWVEHRYFKRQA